MSIRFGNVACLCLRFVAGTLRTLSPRQSVPGKRPVSALLCTVLAVTTCLSVVFGAAPSSRFEWVAEPFALRSIEPSGWPSLAVDGRSAVVLIDGSRRIGLQGPPVEQDLSGTFWRWVYRTEDDRTVTMLVGPGPEESLHLSVSVDDKLPHEKIGIYLRVGTSEGFCGLMERVVQGSQGLSWRPGIQTGLDLRGQSVYLYTLPTVSIYAPYFVSTSGWGLWVDSDWPATYRFGIDDRGVSAPTQVSIEQEGPQLDLLLLPGPTPLDVVRRYARITGLPLVPPEYLLGMGRWRDDVWHLPQFFDGTPYDGPFNTMIVEDILMMDALGIPCSWIIVDRPWASGTFGYGGLQIDPSRLPSFSEMTDWLRGRGIHTLLWVAPWVMDEQRDAALAAGYHVRQTFPYLPEAALIDFTYPDAVEWWIGEITPLFDTGISGFKLDRGEEKPPDGQIFQGTYHDGTSYREGHNAYPLWFARTAAEAARRAGVEEYVSIYRAGWPGMSSVSAAWGGDTDPSSWGLRSAIIALQRAAVLNTPLWGSDTGGYNARPPREVLARWLAFSAFCPIMEVGPLANLAPWSWLPDGVQADVGPDGLPDGTYYDQELLAIWSLYASLRRDLFAYLKELAMQASQDGTPMVRPLFMAFPEQSDLIDSWEQYLLGPDLLVRPVWEPGVSSVDVLVPEGAWIDLWTGERHEGPVRIRVATPLHQIPLFARASAPPHLDALQIRWQEALQRTETMPDLSEWRKGMAW